MSTSRKDYEAIARLVKEQASVEDTTGAYALREFAIKLACYFAEDNPRFEQSKFMKACGF